VDRYIVERSTNGINFSVLKPVKAFNNSNFSNYSIIDSFPVSGNNFYRLKIIDKNGRVNYTRVENVHINNKMPSITIYPNPVANKLVHLQFSDLPAGKFHFIIYDAIGQCVFNKIVEHAGGASIESLALPFTIKTGNYDRRNGCKCRKNPSRSCPFRIIFGPPRGPDRCPLLLRSNKTPARGRGFAFEI